MDLNYRNRPRKGKTPKDKCMYMRLSAGEEKLIGELSEELGKNKTDVIRYAVRLLAEWYGYDGGVVSTDGIEIEGD